MRALRIIIKNFECPCANDWNNQSARNNLSNPYSNQGHIDYIIHYLCFNFECKGSAFF